MGRPDKIKSWQMTQCTTGNKETGEIRPGKLELVEIPVPDLKTGEVLVEVAGCGLCHMDIGYFYDGVPTIHKPPLILGHEISGTVVEGDKNWVDKEVLGTGDSRSLYDTRLKVERENLARSG